MTSYYTARPSAESLTGDVQGQCQEARCEKASPPHTFERRFTVAMENGLVVTVVIGERRA
jgi:hypothetical protein